MGSSKLEEANKKCAKIKQVYENCFRNWYSQEFIKGNVLPGCQVSEVPFGENSLRG